MYKLLLIIGLSIASFATYTNCNMKNKNYEEVCERAVKLGVSYEYVNSFLLSYEKVNKIDAKSWKYLHPDKILKLRKNEKKANNTLLPHVPRIVRHLKKYKEVYDFSEKVFGVNREVVAAILMKETALGRIKLKHDAFEVCNTLVLKTNPKTPRDKWLLKMGKSNMVAVIDYCYKKGLSPKKCNLPSSYAGAVGIPQFMPDSFIYTQGYKTTLAEKASFTKLIDWDKFKDIEVIESAWYKYELKYKNSSLVYEVNKRDNKVYDCFLCNDEAHQYLRAYAKKIMVYNNSSNYSIGVLRLAYEAHKGLIDE